jgi:hypothetical protein
MLKVKAMILAVVAAALAAIGIPATASATYTVPYGNAALGDAIWNETWAPESVVGGNNNCKATSAHPYPNSQQGCSTPRCAIATRTRGKLGSSCTNYGQGI